MSTLCGPLPYHTGIMKALLYFSHGCIAPSSNQLATPLEESSGHDNLFVLPSLSDDLHSDRKGRESGGVLHRSRRRRTKAARHTHRGVTRYVEGTSIVGRADGGFQSFQNRSRVSILELVVGRGRGAASLRRERHRDRGSTGHDEEVDVFERAIIYHTQFGDFAVGFDFDARCHLVVGESAAGEVCWVRG